jgi:hypothetical protein
MGARRLCKPYAATANVHSNCKFSILLSGNDLAQATLPTAANGTRVASRTNSLRFAPVAVSEADGRAVSST